MDWGSHISKGKLYLLKEIKAYRGTNTVMFSTDSILIIPFYADTQTVHDIFNREEHSPSKQELKQITVQWAKALGINLG